MAGVFFVDNNSAGVVFGATSAVIVAIESTDVRVKRQARDQVADGGTVVVFTMAMAVAIGGSLAAAFALPQTRLPGGWATFSTGVVLTWLGIAVNRWARLTLGHAYRPIVTVIEDHRVVTSGPYRFVQHPMYAGAVLMCVGMSALIGTWIGVGLWLLPPAALIRRIRVEETVLTEHLGPDYLSFRDSRARLLPGIW